MIRFRRTTPDDIRLHSLQEACLPGDWPRDFSRDVVWIGCDPAGNDVAFCAVRLLDDGQWYLSRAGVVPEARGHGLQRRMIRLRVRHARKLTPGCMLITDTTYDNLASANSLMACGFRLYEPGERWAFESGLYWRLQC